MRRFVRHRTVQKLTREEEIALLLRSRKIAAEQNAKQAAAAKTESLDRYDEAVLDPAKLREERRQSMAAIIKRNREKKET